MFIKAAAGIDEVLWLWGHYSQWLPFIGSIITGKSASFHYSVLVVSRIFFNCSKNKNNNNYVNNYLVSPR